MSDVDHDPAPSADGILLQRCLDAPAATRSSVLATLCAEHPERADALRDLYALLQDYGLADDPPPRQELPELERFGPYRVLQRIGRGGMGIVYLAEQEPLGKRVALKVLHAGFADHPKARDRFRREALAAARLDHPGICPVYDAGAVDDTPFLAMRYVPGRSLQQIVAACRSAGRDCAHLPGPPGAGPIAAILHCLRQLALALHSAHEAGLVHRDVKPGNIMIGADGSPVLVDFGLARLDDRDDRDESLTRAGDQIGTPSYMAPEQVRGGAIDRRTDVHALGVVLYECLTLQLPFAAADRHGLATQILRDDPPDPRRRQRAIGRDLWTVLQTALAKEPDRRYQSALAFAEDLRRVLGHEPILARRASPALRCWRFAQRHPLAASLLLLLGATAAAFAVLLRQRDAALVTTQAIEQALRANEHGDTAPREAVRSALGAVRQRANVDTRSALAGALADYAEAAVLPHTHSVWTARLSPDERTLLTCSDDQSIRLWDLDGRERRRRDFDRNYTWAEWASDGRFLAAALDGTVTVFGADGSTATEFVHGTRRPPRSPQSLYNPNLANVVWMARFSPDGTRIASVASDRRIVVSDAHTGAPLGTFQHDGPASFVQWFRDGRRLVSSEDFVGFLPDRNRYPVCVLEHDGGSLNLLHRFELPGQVLWLDVAPDDGALVAACDDGNAWYIDLQAKPPTPRALAHGSAVQRVCFAPDGRHFATGCHDGTLRLWTREGTSVAVARHDGPVTDLTFGAGGRRIVTGGEDFTVRVFDADLRPLQVLRGHREKVQSVAMSADGRRVVSAAWDRTARVWHHQDPDLPRFVGHTARVRSVVRLPDGDLVSAGDDRWLRRWNVDGHEVARHPLDAPPSGITVIAGGRQLLLGHDDAVARRYDVATGAVVGRYPHPQGRGACATELADGRVVTGSYGGALRVFAADGTGGDAWTRETGTFLALAHAPGLGLVAGVGWRHELLLWNESGALRASPFAAPAWTSAAAFAPAEDRLALGSDDGCVRIFQIAAQAEPTGQPTTLSGHQGKVLAVAWAQDGRHLAAGISDGTVHVWRVDGAEPEQRLVLRGHDGAVRAVLWLDPERLVSGGDDGDLQTWVTSDHALLALAERRLAATEAAPEHTLADYFEMATRGDPAASAVGEELLQRATAAGQVQRLNQLAWNLVKPDGAVPQPDLALALRAAEAAVRISEGKRGAMLDTLARVHFLRGEVARAVEWQERAITATERAPQTGNLEQQRQVLAEYRARLAK